MHHCAAGPRALTLFHPMLHEHAYPYRIVWYGLVCALHYNYRDGKHCAARQQQQGAVPGHVGHCDNVAPVQGCLIKVVSMYICDPACTWVGGGGGVTWYHVPLCSHETGVQRVPCC